MSEKISVMSFNLRCAVKIDGVNYFEERAPRVLAMLEREKPDVIGFQEVKPIQHEYLSRALTDYTVVGCGRGADLRDESMTVAFRHDRFALLSLKQFWLSPTPAVPGSRFPEDQSDCPRVTAALVLGLIGTGKTVTFLNTHLDHHGPRARYDGMTENIQILSQMPRPWVLVGDMNATPAAPEIKLVDDALGSLGVRDVTADCGGTFHGYGQVTPPDKIDYIFTDAPAADCRVVADEGKNGLYYSDHYAIVATLTL